MTWFDTAEADWVRSVLSELEIVRNTRAGFLYRAEVSETRSRRSARVVAEAANDRLVVLDLAREQQGASQHRNTVTTTLVPRSAVLGLTLTQTFTSDEQGHGSTLLEAVTIHLHPGLPFENLELIAENHGYKDDNEGPTRLYELARELQATSTGVEPSAHLPITES